MQTFWAVLKDSYKEAISGWILQVLLVLAGLFMLVVLSLSYRHVGPEEQVKKEYDIYTFLLKNDVNAGQPQFRVENFVQTNTGPYWRGNYQFDILIQCPDEASLKKLKKIFNLPVDKESQIEHNRKAVPFKASEGTVKATPANEQRITYTTTDTDAEDGLSWAAAPKIFFFWELGQVFWVSPRLMVYRLEKNIFGDFGMLAGLVISVIITAGFIPNMLRKGSLDLYISKPIGRVQLLLMKYFGGMVYMILLSTFTVVGVWLAVGIKSGVWSPGFLLMIPVLTFYFALLYAISTFVAVLTRNMMVAILITCLLWGLVTGVGYAHETIEAMNESAKEQVIKVKKAQGEAGATEDEIRATQPVSSFWEDALFGLRRTLPRTYDVDKLAGRMIAKSVLSDSEYKARKFDTDIGVSWGEVIIVSCLQIALLLGLACWRMVTRDG